MMTALDRLAKAEKIIRMVHRCRKTIRCKDCAEAVSAFLTLSPGAPVTMANETIQKARKAVEELRDFARMNGMDHRQRDPLVMAIHAAIDALERSQVKRVRQNGETK